MCTRPAVSANTSNWVLAELIRPAARWPARRTASAQRGMTGLTEIAALVVTARIKCAATYSAAGMTRRIAAAAVNARTILRTAGTAAIVVAFIAAHAA